MSIWKECCQDQSAVKNCVADQRLRGHPADDIRYSDSSLLLLVKVT